MRRNNLATIVIGRNLLEEGAGYALRFSGDEMKGRTRRGGPVPNALTPFIDRYIEIYRPRLLLGNSDEHNVLFISGMGNPITPHNLSDEIGKITFAVFGRRVTAHESAMQPQVRSQRKTRITSGSCLRSWVMPTIGRRNAITSSPMRWPRSIASTRLSNG